MINLEWVQRLEAARFLLTKREQAIIAYLEAHFDALPQLNVQDLVDATNTSKPTVHRLCKKLGYEGFKAFKKALNQQNQALRAPLLTRSFEDLTPQRASESAMFEATSAFAVFQKGFQVDLLALQRTAATLTEAQVTRIVDLIRQAGTIYCVGYQTGLFPARFLAERLSRLKMKTQLATGERRAVIDAVFPIAEGDLLFLFEYHHAFDLHRRLYDLARKRGAAIFLMTDYPVSPVVASADETIIVHRGQPDFKNSLAVPMTVVNNLLLAVEFALGDKCVQYLAEWEKLNT